MAQTIKINKRRRIKMTGLEFLNEEDNGLIFEIVNELQRKYLASGYMLIPSVEEVSERMEELILSCGYSEISVETIFFESAQILGMKMKK
jgi:hypothetical protein